MNQIELDATGTLLWPGAAVLAAPATRRGSMSQQPSTKYQQ